jgi:hypothetical protein
VSPYNGAWDETTIGSPQAGVVLPRLANIYLDCFDQKAKFKGTAGKLILRSHGMSVEDSSRR